MKERIALTNPTAVIGRATVCLIVTDNNDHRTCSNCQASPLAEGFIVNDGDAYYCSSECFDEHDATLYGSFRADGGDDDTDEDEPDWCFWTTWHDDGDDELQAPSLCVMCELLPPLAHENESRNTVEDLFYCSCSCNSRSVERSRLSQLARLAFSGSYLSQPLVQTILSGDCAIDVPEVTP